MLTSSLVLFLLQAPDALLGPVPHPSYPIRAGVAAAEAPLGAGNRWPAEDRGWVVLEPSWIRRRPELLGEEGFEALLQYLQQGLGLDRAGVEAWRASAGLEPVAVQYRLRREGDGEILLAGTEPVWPGRPAVFADRRSRNVVSGVDVEIAQSSQIGEPVEALQWEGISLALELWPVPGAGWRAEVALVHTRFGAPERIPLRYHLFHGKDRLRQDLAETGLTLLLRAPAGGGPATGRVLLPALEGSSCLLELVLDPGAPPTALPVGSRAVVVAAPALAADPALHAELVGRMPEIAWNGQGWFLLSGGGAQAAAEEVAALAREREAPLHADLRVTLAEEGEPRTLALLQSSVVRGAPVRFARGELAQALTGWDVEVAQASRIADPQFSQEFSGVLGGFTVRREGAGARGPVVDLFLRIREVQLGDSEDLLVGSEQPLLVGGDAPPALLVQELLTVERPSVAEVAFEGRYQPDRDGRIVLERSVNLLHGRGGTVRVELRLQAP